MTLDTCPFEEDEIAHIVPEVVEFHEKKNTEYEYGISMVDCIEVYHSEIARMVDDWWNNLPVEEKISKVKEKLCNLKLKCDYFEEYLKVAEENS